MSVKTNNHHTPTPVCKHCKNLNAKDSRIPYDHWLRESPDPKSRIVCPKLKGVECSWCGDYAHTKKYCKDLIKYIQERNGVYVAENATNVLPRRNRAMPANTFAILGEIDSDIEEELTYAKECYDADILIRPPSPLAPPPPHIGIFSPSRISKTGFPALSSNPNKTRAGLLHSGQTQGKCSRTKT